MVATVTATYDPSLPADLDHVRFLIGDTNTDDAKLSDEEILAVIDEETATGLALKYYVAASCLSVLRTRWSSQGEGVLEKQVGDLRVRRGMDTSASEAMTQRISELRKRGASLMGESPTVFRML